MALERVAAKEEVQACHGASFTCSVSVIETHPAESENMTGQGLPPLSSAQNLKTVLWVVM